MLTATSGLTGVGFPRKVAGREAKKASGWEGIAGMPFGTVARTITYEEAFDRCDWVEDLAGLDIFFSRIEMDKPLHGSRAHPSQAA